MKKLLAAIYTIFALTAHAEVKIYREPEALQGYALGSGLHRLDGKEPRFIMITDRGPNADGPKVTLRSGEKAKSKIFPNPDFTPSIAFVKLAGDSFLVEKLIPIRKADGGEIKGVSDSDDAPALDLALNRIRPREEGFDPEAVTVAKNGDIWVVEEHRPAVIQLDPAGQIKRVYSPGQGIPELFKERKPNRGFEGVTFLPDGRILATLQSPIPELKTTCTVVPFLLLHPGGAGAELVGFTSPWPEDEDLKIGDVAAISNNEVLLLVNREVDGKVRNEVVSFKWKESFVAERVNKLPDNLCSVSTEVKTLLNLNELGWQHEKAEGLTISSDGKRIYVSNDNDFGLKIYIKPKKLMIDGSGELKLKRDKGELLTAEHDPTPGTEIWEIDLPR